MYMFRPCDRKYDWDSEDPASWRLPAHEESGSLDSQIAFRRSAGIESDSCGIDLDQHRFVDVAEKSGVICQIFYEWHA